LPPLWIRRGRGLNPAVPPLSVEVTARNGTTSPTIIGLLQNGPRLHQLAALLQHIAAPARLLGLATDLSSVITLECPGRRGPLRRARAGNSYARRPNRYDGIVAAALVYDTEAIVLGGPRAAKAIEAITPAPLHQPPNKNPVFRPAFPQADQKRFTSAHLAAHDGLDGRVDGVVDNLRACRAKFDLAIFVFPDTGQPLQCAATKTATCLSPAQINAVKKVNDGPRNSLGERTKAPTGAAASEHAGQCGLRLYL
jgi:Tannase and feruloyl esterase